MKLRWPKTKNISRGLDRGQMNKYRVFTMNNTTTATIENIT
jgi:hypothetical protein